jgi:1,4-dihydroxy-2-naphthoate octaprenyltransferase
VYGLLVAAFLWINEFPDFEADRSAGKRTCVVRLGKHRAAIVFALLCACAWLGFLVALAWALPRLAALGLAGAFFSLRASRKLWRAWESTPAIVPAQKDALAAFVVFALGVSLGYLARH